MLSLRISVVAALVPLLVACGDDGTTSGTSAGGADTTSGTGGDAGTGGQATTTASSSASTTTSASSTTSSSAATTSGGEGGEGGAGDGGAGGSGAGGSGSGGDDEGCEVELVGSSIDCDADCNAAYSNESMDAFMCTITCEDSAECSDDDSIVCLAPVPGASICVFSCDGGNACPSGYVCEQERLFCIPDVADA